MLHYRHLVIVFWNTIIGLGARVGLVLNFLLGLFVFVSSASQFLAPITSKGSISSQSVIGVEFSYVLNPFLQLLWVSGITNQVVAGVVHFFLGLLIAGISLYLWSYPNPTIWVLLIIGESALFYGAFFWKLSQICKDFYDPVNFREADKTDIYTARRFAMQESLILSEDCTTRVFQMLILGVGTGQVAFVCLWFGIQQRLLKFPTMYERLITH